MKIQQLRKPEPRIETPYVSALELKSYGERNLYPQEVRNIVLSSANGRNCYERRANYIEGNGIASLALAETVCSFNGDKVDDVLSKVSEDVAMYDGFALHVNYNVLGEISSIAHVPFEDVRLKEPNEQGEITKLFVHSDWTGKETRAGKRNAPKKETVASFPPFNPNPRHVQEEIERSGGIDEYKGQVLYVTRSGRNEYTTPIFDAALTDMSTDEGLANVNNRNVRYNFLTGGIVFVKKGSGNSAEFDEDSFVSQIEHLQGDVNACKLLVVVGETDEDKPEVIPFSSVNFDKEFTATASAVVANIYAAFNQDMFYRLRQGSIGFSGRIAGEVNLWYCEQVTKQQRMISRIFASIFEHWAAGQMPYNGKDDVAIEPLYKATGNAAEL